MGKLLRFIAFMVPLMAGAFVGNCLAAKIWPELKEKSPWFWLATGGMGSVGGMLAMRLLFGKRPQAKRVPKTDPVIPDTPSVPKTYEEWRKDLDRTVDENAADFMTLDEWRDKWRDVPRTPKPAPASKLEDPVSEAVDKVMSAMDNAWVAAIAPVPVPNVVGAPENVIKYVREETKKSAVQPLDSFTGPGPFLNGGSIRASVDGTVFQRGAAGPVHFYCDADRLSLDGVEYAVPQGGVLVVHVPAGNHHVRAIPWNFGAPEQRHPQPSPRIVP